jgi:hypothetical protein
MTIFAKPEPLTDTELDRLGDFLKSCKSGKAMNVEELDGFFAALIAGPETVMDGWPALLVLRDRLCFTILYYSSNIKLQLIYCCLGAPSSTVFEGGAFGSACHAKSTDSPV